MSEPSIPIIVPPHELTDDTVPVFETLLTPHLDAGSPGIVVDLDEVAFISSGGLGCLVKFGMRLDGQGRRLVLARPDRNVERSLRLIGLQSKLPMFPSLEDALRHVGQPGG